MSSLLDTGLNPLAHLGAVYRDDPVEALKLEEEAAETLGHFKVQLRSVLPSLYVALNNADTYELDPGTGCIWNDGHELIIDDHELYERREQESIYRGKPFILRPLLE